VILNKDACFYKCSGHETQLTFYLIIKIPFIQFCACWQNYEQMGQGEKVNESLQELVLDVAQFQRYLPDNHLIR
jgi:hypothetical protein